MGGGGGSGHADNTGLYPSTPSGGNGGGIIIIMADSLSLFGNTIFANGNTAQYCYSADCSDGRGGGGGGGTVLLKVNKIVDSLTVENQGGDGAFVTGTITAGRNAGPGGGGGGGAFFISKNTLPLNTAVINSGGISGFINTPGNNWGATAGAAGLNFFNLKLPFDTAFFIKNIDSVRIRDSIITCNKYNFSGNAFTNTFPIASWTWNFGDGTTGSGQNITHAYLSESTFPVSLFASDINGCRDSVTTIASPIVIPVNAGADTTVCSNSAITVTLNGTGTGSYAWSPATLLNDSTLINPLQRSIQQQFFIYLLPAIIAQYQIQ